MSRFAVLLLIICSAAALAQGPAGELEVHYARARQAEEMGDYSRAAREWKAITTLAPDLAEAHSNLGMMYHLAGQYELATAAFQQALQLNPKLLSARLFLGIDYHLTSRPEEAIAQLRQALGISPNDSLARKWLGMSYLQFGESGNAVLELRKCRGSQPQDEDLLFYLGRAYSRLALLSYKNVEQLAGESGWDHVVKAEHYIPQGSLLRAQVELRQVLTENPRFPQIHRRIGEVLELQKEHEAAQREFKLDSANTAALAAAETGKSGWAVSIRIALERGDAAAARRVLERGASTAPADERTYWQARVLLQEGKAEQALEGLLKTAQSSRDPERHYYLGQAAERLSIDNLARYLTVAPDSYRAHQLQAEYDLAQGNENLAIEEYRRALDRNPEAVQIHLALGNIYATRHENEPARTEYEAELRADQYSVVALQRIGQVLVELHQPEQAKLYFSRALKLNPNSAEAHKGWGMACLQQGEYEEAVEHLQRSLALMPANGEIDETVYYQLARGLRKLGRLAEAQQQEAIFGKLKVTKHEKVQRRLEEATENRSASSP